MAKHYFTPTELIIIANSKQITDFLEKLFNIRFYFSATELIDVGLLSFSSDSSIKTTKQYTFIFSDNSFRDTSYSKVPKKKIKSIIELMSSYAAYSRSYVDEIRCYKIAEILS